SCFHRLLFVPHHFASVTDRVLQSAFMPNRSYSQSSFSASSKTSNSPTESAKSPQQSARLQCLLKKHLSAFQIQASRVEQYHQREFTDQLDSIVQQWMVEAIFELKQFAEKELTTEVEDAMIGTIRAQLDRHLPLPTTEEQ